MFFIIQTGKPCSGEKLLLLFDRWRKLLKAFYSEKKGHFDISKVPDIYDAAKYDAIHNAHLGIDLKPVYEVAKVLAAAVIPNEYGITPSSKLRIGSMICAQLLGKLLCDLASMREESFATSGLQHADDSNVWMDKVGNEFHEMDMNGELGKTNSAPMAPLSEDPAVHADDAYAYADDDEKDDKEEGVEDMEGVPASAGGGSGEGNTTGDEIHGNGAFLIIIIII